eukprot:jgi/Botrbrau1/18560/Bobra.0367s0009.2
METLGADVGASVKVPVPAPTTPVQPGALPDMGTQVLVSPGLPSTPLPGGPPLPKWPVALSETPETLKEPGMSKTLQLQYDSPSFVNLPGNAPAPMSSTQQQRGSCTPEVAPEGPQVSHSPSSGMEHTESPGNSHRARPGILWRESTRKWEAHGFANGRLELLGCFDTEEAAQQYARHALGYAGGGAMISPPKKPIPRLPGGPLLTVSSSGPRKASRKKGPHSHNSSIYRGVSWSTCTGKWRAQIWKGNDVSHLGYFEDEVKAAIAYDEAALANKGPGAITNFCPSSYGYPKPDPTQSKRKQKSGVKRRSPSSNPPFASESSPAPGAFIGGSSAGHPQKPSEDMELEILQGQSRGWGATKSRSHSEETNPQLAGRLPPTPLGDVTEVSPHVARRKRTCSRKPSLAGLASHLVHEPAAEEAAEALASMSSGDGETLSPRSSDPEGISGTAGIEEAPIPRLSRLISPFTKRLNSPSSCKESPAGSSPKTGQEPDALLGGRRRSTRISDAHDAFAASLLTGLACKGDAEPSSRASPAISEGGGSSRKRGSVGRGTASESAAKSSKFKGVSWHKHSQKWYAYIQASGKMRGLGYFDDQEDAARAYDAEARKVHGAKAVVNFDLEGNRILRECPSRGRSLPSSAVNSEDMASADESNPGDTPRSRHRPTSLPWGPAPSGVPSRMPGSRPNSSGAATSVGSEEDPSAWGTRRPPYKKPAAHSAYKGVSWHKHRRMWQVYIHVPQGASRSYHHGYFDDEIEAARAYDREVLRVRGPTTPTNFPLSDYINADGTFINPAHASSSGKGEARSRPGSSGKAASPPPPRGAKGASRRQHADSHFEPIEKPDALYMLMNAAMSLDAPARESDEESWREEPPLKKRWRRSGTPRPPAPDQRGRVLGSSQDAGLIHRSASPHSIGPCSATRSSTPPPSQQNRLGSSGQILWSPTGAAVTPLIAQAVDLFTSNSPKPVPHTPATAVEIPPRRHPPIKPPPLAEDAHSKGSFPEFAALMHAAKVFPLSVDERQPMELDQQGSQGGDPMGADGTMAVQQPRDNDAAAALAPTPRNDGAEDPGSTEGPQEKETEHMDVDPQVQNSTAGLTQSGRGHTDVPEIEVSLPGQAKISSYYRSVGSPAWKWDTQGPGRAAARTDAGSHPRSIRRGSPSWTVSRGLGAVSEASPLGTQSHPEGESCETGEGKRVSSFRGVTWSKQTHKWRAEIEIDGCVQFLGSSANEEDAARMVDRALLQHPAYPGRLNHPPAEFQMPLWMKLGTGLSPDDTRVQGAGEALGGPPNVKVEPSSGLKDPMDINEGTPKASTPKSGKQPRSPHSPRGTSKYRGVSWCEKGKKWRSLLWDGAKQRFLGHFANEVDAARAFDRNSIMLKGKDAAKLNFPISDYNLEELAAQFASAPQGPPEAFHPSAEISQSQSKQTSASNKQPPVEGPREPQDVATQGTEQERTAQAPKAQAPVFREQLMTPVVPPASPANPFGEQLRREQMHGESPGVPGVGGTLLLANTLLSRLDNASRASPLINPATCIPSPQEIETPVQRPRHFAAGGDGLEAQGSLTPLGDPNREPQLYCMTPEAQGPPDAGTWRPSRSCSEASPHEEPGALKEAPDAEPSQATLAQVMPSPLEAPQGLVHGSSAPHLGPSLGRQAPKQVGKRSRTPDPSSTVHGPEGRDRVWWPGPGKRSSRFKGVSWSDSSNKWRAQCWNGSKVQYIGYYESEEDAARAYDTAILQLRGPLMQTNFPATNYESRTNADGQGEGEVENPQGHIGGTGSPGGRSGIQRGTSKYKGVSWSERSHKWRAQLWHDNKVRHLGFYDDEVEAAKAYDRAVVELRGTSAQTNFPIAGAGGARPLISHATVTPSQSAGGTPVPTTEGPISPPRVRGSPNAKGSSPYRGVRWHERNTKWEARIFDGQKQISLGYYDTEEAAAKAYDVRALRLRGPNTQVNFPQSPVAEPAPPHMHGSDGPGDSARRRRSLSFTPDSPVHTPPGPGVLGPADSTSPSGWGVRKPRSGVPGLPPRSPIDSSRAPRVSLYRGVSYDTGTCKWWAHFANGAHIRQLGAFDSEVEAAQAHDQEAIRMHGSRAVTNFPHPEVQAIKQPLFGSPVPHSGAPPAGQ